MLDPQISQITHGRGSAIADSGSLKIETTIQDIYLLILDSLKFNSMRLNDAKNIQTIRVGLSILDISFVLS